ncbi:MAG: hypothetical protein ABIO67_06335, partial [Mycobacteriales bacterium]
RMRVTIAAPNGTQPIWAFDETAPSGATSIAFSSTMPSSLVLPVVPDVSVPTAQPPCPSLRNMPCRPYVALANRATPANAAAGRGSGVTPPTGPLPATGLPLSIPAIALLFLAGVFGLRRSRFGVPSN